MDRTILSAIRQRHSDNLDLRFLKIGAHWISRSTFWLRVDDRADALMSKGLTAGDKVVLYSGRGDGFWVDMMAIWRIGAIIVPLDPLINESLRKEIFSKVTPRFCLGEKDIVFSDVARSTNRNIAAILFTSGSTGKAKGVMLTHAALLGNAQGILSLLPLNAQSRFATAIAFHFTSAICHFIATGLSGAMLVAIEERLMPGDFITFLEVENVSGFGGSPLQIEWISQSLAKLNAIRWVMSSGDFLPVSTIQNLTGKLDVYTVYGLTEVGGRLCCLPPSQASQFAGSVGKPIQGFSIAIRSENGDLLDPNVEGEIYVTGDFFMDGYYLDEDETRKTLTSQGLRTGDLGHLSESGDLYLSGRVDDVFKVSGQKVSAIQIQKTISLVLDVQDLAVVPVELPHLGRVPVLFFVCNEGGVFNQAIFMRKLRDMLPNTHMPRKFVEVAQIPRTGSGKVMRSVLKDMIN